MESNGTVAIILSTYNGEKYLNEQIESIINQTFKDWYLYVRDDGSTDSTKHILYKWAAKEKRIRIKEDQLGNLGVAKSYLSLLSCVAADYYMFCDQDDVWLPYKIEKSIDKIQSVELYSKNKPLLVFSDLRVVDKDLSVLGHSFYSNRGIEKMVFKQQFSLLASMIPGCVMLFNNRAKCLCESYNENTGVLHDYYLVLMVLSNHGRIVGIKEPLILYRQHGNNVVGAGSLSGPLRNKFSSLRTVVKDNISIYHTVNTLARVSLLKYIGLKMLSLFYIKRK